MVFNKFSFKDVIECVGEFDFFGFVFEFFEGMMGQLYGGFFELFCIKVFCGCCKFDKCFGFFFEFIDFVKVRKELLCKYGSVIECDVVSYIMYFKVFVDYKVFIVKYGDFSVLFIKYFFSKFEIGEEFYVEFEKGKVLIFKLLVVGLFFENIGQCEVFYEMNGEVC